jgi:glycopeptide antibiotics resistance protein
MVDLSRSWLQLRIVGVLCIFVLCGILVAGFWPFHAPVNQVTWLKNANGLRFGDHGTILSSGALTTPSTEEEASCSLEIFFHSRLVEDSNTILAFYTPGNPIRFSMHQSEANLALQSGPQDQHLQAKRPSVLYVDDVFRAKRPLLIAIASGVQGTKIYVNGAVARTAPQFRLSIKDFAGQLVLGTSPVVNDSWSGQLQGLAIYQQELTAAQVSRHFKTWTDNGRPDLEQNEHALALYLFDEHQGRTVHDRSGSGIDLDIPEHYVIVHEKFLEPPSKEFYQGSSYWKNIGINIGGFIPLGFFFCAYLTLARQMSRPVLVTIVLGAAVSFTIEALQAYLPTRDSGMTDIITNTLGTSLGVALYRWNPALFSEVLNRVAALRPLAQLASIGERS